MKTNQFTLSRLAAFGSKMSTGLALPRISAISKVEASQLVITASIFMVLTGNLTFFSQLEAIYPLNLGNVGFMASLVLLQVSLLAMCLFLLCVSWLTKPVLVVALLVTAMAAYFQDRFGVVFDQEIILSLFSTNVKEAVDLFNVELLFRTVVFGLLPAILIIRTPLVKRPVLQALLRNFIGVVSCLVAVALLFFAFSGSYTTFFREHKIVRYYSNPIAPLYALATSLHATSPVQHKNPKVILPDAVKAVGKPRLIILVVGEATRADRLEVNGYARETNPGLKHEKIISYGHMSSCGTATAISVPCMFSQLSRRDFSVGAAKQQENVLDILQRVGVNVLWRDNNSDSKGVAHRVPYQSYRTSETNKDCDTECRDKGMLEGLKEKFAKANPQDTLIVLHQMGSHGPAYYKRYPATAAYFQPTCDTAELAKCSQQSLDNSYDNSIRYTDSFLTSVISLLKAEVQKYQTAMVYISDHGESLGEFGLYLHGVPYVMAPDVQKHVPMIAWFSDNFPISTSDLEKTASQPHSQDELFNALLGLFRVSSASDPIEQRLLPGVGS